MPSFTYDQTLAAGASANPLTGWQYEYLPFPAAITLLTTSDQVDTLLQITSGSETIQEAAPVTKGTAHVIPNQFNCTPHRWVGAAGDRLKLNFRAVTAAIISGVINVSPLR